MSAGLRVPAHAQPAWLTLHDQIMRTGPTPCAGPDRDDWIGNAAEQRTAADACLDCPVMDACLNYAITADEWEGVWGGMGPAERKRWTG